MKIGLFDSGLGGLTVLRQIIREYIQLRSDSDLELYYLADNKNAPYGNKSKSELENIVSENIRTLQDIGCEYIISACNTASKIKSDTHNYFEMISPVVEYCTQNRYNKILLFATVATVDNKIYDTEFSKYNISTTSVAMPNLASLIDKGDSVDNIKEIDSYIKEIIGNLNSNNETKKYDAVILGCTHYPLVAHIFEKYLAPNTRVLDPAVYIAKRLIAKIMTDHKYLDATTHCGIKIHLITTSDDNSKNKIIEDYMREIFAKYEINLIN